MLMLQGECSLQVVHVIASKHYLVGFHTAQASTQVMKQPKGKQCRCTKLKRGKTLSKSLS